MRLPRLLWVDAVCINQADVEERGRQVRIMDRIYSGCVEVLVFLGGIWTALQNQRTNGADTASPREYTSNIFGEGKVDIFYHWRNLVRSRARDPEHDAYVGGGTWADAWWRTLCLDHGWGPGRQLQRASEDKIRVLSTPIEREEPCMTLKTLHEVEEARKAAGPGMSFDDEGPVATEYGSAYKLAGDSYIQGIMDGEAVAATGSAAVSLLIA